MGILKKITSSIGGSEDTWKDRVRTGILLTSPSGKEFEASWRGDEFSKDKKLQISYYSGVKGNRVKDHGINSATIPIVFYFHGSTNDLQAKLFWDACNEDGQWSISHPVHGFLSLQLVSVTMANQPVESGNITEVTTDWIEPLNKEAKENARQLGSMADAVGTKLNEASANGFLDKLKAGTEALKAGIANTVEAVGGISNKVLGPIAALNDAIWVSFMAIQNGIADIRNLTVLEALSIIGQIQNLIQLPLRSTTDHRSRMAAYKDLAEKNLMLTNDIERREEIGISENDKNNALIVEAASMATIVSLADIATTSVIRTSYEAIELIATIQSIVDSITDSMEETQGIFKDEFPENEYVYSSDTGEIINELVYITSKYLRVVANNLKAEKRIVLSEPKTPLMVVLEEYGGDDRFEEFVSVNNLVLEDILYLEAGREIILNA